MRAQIKVVIVFHRQSHTCCGDIIASEQPIIISHQLLDLYARDTLCLYSCSFSLIVDTGFGNDMVNDFIKQFQLISLGIALNLFQLSHNNLYPLIGYIVIWQVCLIGKNDEADETLIADRRTIPSIKCSQ